MNTQHHFRTWSELSAFHESSGLSVMIAMATADLTASGLQLRVSGLARGGDECRLELRGVSVSAETTAEVDSSGRFAAELMLPIQQVGSLLSVRATVAEGEMVVSDSVIFSLDAQSPPPPGEIHPLDPARLGYGAGTVDQIKLSHSFVRYDAEIDWIVPFVQKSLQHAHFRSDKGELYRCSAKSTGSKRKKEPLGASTGTRKGRFTATRRELEERTGIRLVKLSETEAQSLEQRVHNASRGKSSTVGHENVPVIYEWTIIDEIEKTIQEMGRANQSLGVLFNERLRIRPIRQVPGEPIYQLSIMPDEHVEIQQRTETKRTTALAEITDREEERNSSLSSTWSTDLGSTIGSSSGVQNSTSLGAGIDATVPKIDLGLSGSAATTASTAHTSSGSDSVNTHFERTAQVASRLRSQHKIQLEISTEEASSFASTRKLTNSNRLRTQHHEFFKVYRKEQVTLERYDARLCLRLRVDDPGKSVRNAFLAGIAKIHPRTRARRLVTPPPFTHFESDTERVDPPNIEEPYIHGLKMSRVSRFAGDLRTRFGVAEGRVLAGLPSFYLTKWGYLDESNWGAGRGPDYAVSKEDCTPIDDFLHLPIRGFRGSIEVSNGFDPLDPTDTTFDLSVDLPVEWDSPISQTSSATTYAEFTIETRWTSDEAAVSSYQQNLIQKEAELTEAFDPGAVYELVRVAEKDFVGATIGRALSERLDLPRGFDHHRITEIFDTENAVIDTVGYWATEFARDKREDLLAKILSLPGTYSTDQVLPDALTASSAVVYLPIRLRREEEALALLPETRQFAAVKSADFQTFHETHYGPLFEPEAVEIESHLGPRVPESTKQGADGWKAGWEKPQRKFDVLAQWSEYVPTDGVHVETHLSETVVVDGKADDE